VGDASEIEALRAAVATSPDLHPRLRQLISPDVRVPLVAGWWRPAIVLPESALQWLPTMLRAALVHEMAHIERHDVLTAAFARLVLSCFWFHPAAWLAWRSLRAQAEMAADDRVVLSEADPTTYAEGLLLLARSLRGKHGAFFPAIGMLRDSGLPARLERILNPDHPRLAPARMVRWAVLLAAAIISTALLTLRPVAGVVPGALAEEPEAAPSLTLPPLEILIDAIAANDLAKATSAVNAGANPNTEIAYAHKVGGYLAHTSALYFAADEGRLPIVQMLVEHGAEVNPKTKGGWTPTDVAIHSGFSDVVKYLHERGATCDPLVYAGAIGDLDSVKQLLPAAAAKTVADATIAAAGCNQLATLKELLGEKGDPAKAFRRAALTGAIEAMQFLLDHGVDLKAIGDSVLLAAADYRHPRVIEFLLKAGVKPNPEKKAEYYPLHYAARSDDLETVRLLLDGGADPNCVTADPDLNKGTTPIFEACARDNVEMVRLFIERGARLDIVNQHGFTPALNAAYSHAPRCLAYFLEHGTDRSAVNPKWKCGFMEFVMIFSGEDAMRPEQMTTIARISRNMETVKVLFDHGWDVNAPGVDGSLPISIAVANGQTACMEMLLQRGANVNVVDKRGGTLLTTVLSSPVKEEWRMKVLERLFAAGLDPNVGIDNPVAADAYITSALKTAIIYQPKLVKLMLDHGARFPVEKGSDAEKMLMAATTGDVATVKALLAKGVSPDIADAKGWTPILSASVLGDSAIIRALIDAGAKVNTRDALGLTPVQFSLQKYPDLSDFHLLLEKGADLNTDSQFRASSSVLDRAVTLGDPALTREILQHGAKPNRDPASKDSLFDPIVLASEVMLMPDQKNEKRREIVKILLEFGADPNNLSRSDERRLLYFPVANNMVDLVKFLLEAGIDPRKDPDGGKSIAEQAQRHGSAEMKAIIKAALEKKPTTEK
jgi:serine/threonine-protein phosphatase 6 regulatory ankyrin repeat subunit B